MWHYHGSLNKKLAPGKTLEVELMWKEERLQRIRTLLDTFGRVTIERVVVELSVSRETVRRDFNEMEHLGELKRIRGGAVTLDPRYEPPISLRNNEQVKEKRAIAKQVAKHLKSGQNIFIDTGSTTAILADELASVSGISVITNSLHIAQRLSVEKCRIKHSISSHLLGGILHETIPATYGEKTVSEIYQHHVDVAILSPVALDILYGAMSYDPAEAEIAKAMVANATRIFILADYTKLGMTSRISFCKPQNIDILFTDKKCATTSCFEELKRTLRQIVIG